MAFRDTLTRELNSKLTVNAGDRVTLKFINRTQRPRPFATMGVKGATAPAIAAGGRTTIQFLAPASGNYIHHDPGRASLAEPRTLLGDFVVGVTSN
jgi:FtsP/CotA-like multicopper oxidase with cupredoxin domain